MKWPDKKLIVIDMEKATPVAYINVYEQNDIWIKIQGCEKCGLPSPKRCCGNCPFATEKGCWWHYEGGRVSPKPFRCIALPEIKKNQQQGCSLIYECVQGSKKGKIRRVCDPSGVFK